jgi:hypothetical protein
MKKSINTFFIFLFISFGVYAQSDALIIESSPDIPAKYSGGTAAMYKYFSDNITFKSEDIQARIAGELVFAFVIDTAGKISGIEMKKGINTGINSEVIRILKSTPAWIPAQSHGRTVNSRYSIFLLVDAEKLSIAPMFQ